jgi:hypothetical protein
MEELREEKKKLEEQILKLINEYEDKFECYVYDINLLHNGGRNKCGKLEAKTILVKVEFKLCD